MRSFLKVTLVAGGLAAAGLVGYGAGALGAYAQGGPPPGIGPGIGPGMGPGMILGEGRGDGPPAWARGGRGEQARHGGAGPVRAFFINRDNKDLSNEDVRKIAEAGLLWFGERSWRIGEVKDSGSRTAEFTLTTENGGIIARFTMDRDTGRVRRIA